MTGPNDPEPPLAASPAQRPWPALALALALVALALIVTKPWRQNDDSPLGIVPRVEPAGVAAELKTSPEMDHLAPNFLLETLDGQTVRLSDLRGRPVLLNFWATWCLFCLSEMPAMQRLADQYGERIVVIGVNAGESAADARAFAEQAGIRYTLLLDPATEVSQAYLLPTMPVSFFLDADGVVRFVRYGVLTPPEMERILQPILDSSNELADPPNEPLG